MEASELNKVIDRGEDSRHQFKEKITDARKLAAEEELQRLVQTSRKIYADEILIEESSINDLNTEKFEEYFFLYLSSRIIRSQNFTGQVVRKFAISPTW